MSCDDCTPKDLTHTTPAYRRALLIVALLNLGMGAIEIVGGFLAHSQELKADARDFLGDGAITFLGVVAIRRGHCWRARSAFMQAVFLGSTIENREPADPPHGAWSFPARKSTHKKSRFAGQSTRYNRG